MASAEEDKHLCVSSMQAMLMPAQALASSVAYPCMLQGL